MGRVITFPLRLTCDLMRLPIEGARVALSIVRELVEREVTPPPAPPPPSRQQQSPPPSPPPANGFAPDPFEPLHVPEEPLHVAEEPPEVPEEPLHVSEEPELVAESADPEAADIGTAEVHVLEPWDGYRHLKAHDVIARVGVATAEELAVIELYERLHRGRTTVLNAVEKQLRILANQP